MSTRLLRFLGQVLKTDRLEVNQKKVHSFPEFKEFIRLFNTAPTAPYVLYLGDSVLERISRDDTDTRSLSEIIAERLSSLGKVAVVSHSAYHMGVYDAFIRVLTKTKHQPKIVILPINLRSFSPQWDLNPDWQFDEEIQILNGFVCDHNYETLKQSRPALLAKKYKAIPVTYPHSSFTRIGQFQKVIKKRVRTVEQSRYRWQQIFVFHYLHPLSPNHPKLLLVNKVLEQLSKMGAFAFIYVTPVNCQAGQKVVGNDFIYALQQQVDLVRNQVSPFERSGHAKFLDYSVSLGSEYFFHEFEPTEHLNQNGRQVLANLITEAVLDKFF